jgi:hypothetical protein
MIILWHLQDCVQYQHILFITLETKVNTVMAVTVDL